uniref:SRCR domain-containing protein n=1 Tax=Ascaris lumbricoides TaxID=6252 RepID=A0A0M3IAT1_ASCLU
MCWTFRLLEVKFSGTLQRSYPPMPCSSGYGGRPANCTLAGPLQLMAMDREDVTSKDRVEKVCANEWMLLSET